MKKNFKTITLGLLILSCFSFTPSSSLNKSNENYGSKKFVDTYVGYFIQGDATVSVYVSGSNVTKGAFGVNVGGPFYSASGTYQRVGSHHTVTSFHMVVSGISYDYSGDLLY